MDQEEQEESQEEEDEDQEEKDEDQEEEEDNQGEDDDNQGEQEDEVSQNSLTSINSYLLYYLLSAVSFLSIFLLSFLLPVCT